LIKRLAFHKAGGQELQSTLHVATHLDAPGHFMSGAPRLPDRLVVI
jgi:kynurenine formamidase